MRPSTSAEVADRVVARRRAVALTNHYREVEGLAIAQIAGRLGRSPATIKAYFYDPTGEKAGAVKACYQGVCRGCGAYTRARNGKGEAYGYCRPATPARPRRAGPGRACWPRMREWRDCYGRLPSSYDLSRTHARRLGTEAFERVIEGRWPAASVVTGRFGTWSAARAAVVVQDVEVRASVAALCRSGGGREP